MKKITTDIGINGVYEEEGTPKISDAGDIVEILGYPDKDTSLLFISVQGNTEDGLCSMCDMPTCKGNDRLCMYTKFRCTATDTGVYFKLLDTILEQL